MTNREIYDAIRALEETDPIPGTVERFTWPFKRHKLRQAMMGHGGSLQTFLHWPTVHESLYAGHTDFSQEELDLLNRQAQMAAIDPIIGLGPINRMRASVPLSTAGSSGTYIRQALACQYLDEWLQLGLNGSKSIFEFGGGYGAFACVAARLGFNGKHTIFDFPELVILQRWYHEQLGLTEDIDYITDPTRIPSSTHVYPVHIYYDVFVSICALDETSIEYRKKILDWVNAQHYFIWYTNNYDGVDNAKWFREYFEDERDYVDLLCQEVPNRNQGLLYVSA